MNKPWLTTDLYFVQEWNEMQLIVNKLMKVMQYPKDAPDNLDHPDKLEEIENFKVWIANIYNLSGDLNDDLVVDVLDIFYGALILRY